MHIRRTSRWLSISAKNILQCNPSQSPPDIELLIRRNTLPVRPGRKDPRKVKTQSAVSFLYRIA